MFIDAKIEIHLYKAIDNQKIIIGILKNFDEDKIYVELEGKEISIEKSNISKMKNIYNWEEN